MTPGDSSARERRAAAREQRRSSTDEPEREQDGARGDGPAALAGDALKAAASAAAVGAAVGAARALAGRRRHDDDNHVEAHEPSGASADEPSEEPEEREERPEEREEQPQEREERRARHEEPEPEPEPSVEPASPSDLQGIVRQAREVLRELHGADAETVSSVAHTAHGWCVGLEVVELRRIPNSTDILAIYEVELDGDGGVLRVERKRRYHRAEADREGR